jgi:hypothetical protein
LAAPEGFYECKRTHFFLLQLAVMSVWVLRHFK